MNEQPNVVTARRQAILKLVAEQRIGSQQELADALAAQGVVATQATLSRDLKALRVAKAINTDGEWRYHVAGASDLGGPRLNRLSHQALLDRIQALEEAIFGRSQP